MQLISQRHLRNCSVPTTPGFPPQPLPSELLGPWKAALLEDLGGDINWKNQQNIDKKHHRNRDDKLFQK